MTIDRWGVDIGGEPSSVDAWNTAWDEFLHFRGDPMATLARADEHDDTFAMGSVLCALYLVLGGAPTAAPTVQTHLRRAAGRAAQGVDAAHVEAVALVGAGDLTGAAERWARLGADGDFAAHRFAHDVCLHVGDADRRLAASEAALRAPHGPEAMGLVEGMHSFSLNEVGRYAEAEEFGRRALAADPDDLWARHALAHVYEETDHTDAAFALLADTTQVWADCDSLANHIWWHLALRMLAVGDIGGVLDVFDDTLPDVSTAFRLCDHSSLLWRAELAGFDVGDRWDALADRWDTITERHTCGFLDLHATLVYLRRPDHPGAHRWFAGMGEPAVGGELGQIHEQVAQPLVAAFRARAAGDHTGFAATLDRLGHTIARIGGSNAQRHLITLTREATP